MEKKLDFDDVFGLWQPHWWENPWNVVAVVLLGLVVIFAVFWIMKRLGARQHALDPRTRALQQLYAVNPEHLPASKDFYVALLAIMRNYLDSRYKLESSSKTEHELIDYLKLNGPVEEWVTAVEHVMQHGFLIKFAQGDVDAAAAQHDYALVIDLFNKEKEPDKAEK